ncbi:hypothetical protein PG985_001632 [Apiospora marii]|uniref:uncharacterized protein n=1 Tax=Apiospora marii TaxID=335849 RepID=UPI00312D044F
MSVIGTGTIPWGAEGGLGSLASVSIGVLVVYLLSAAAYRVLLHPLHDIPGPTLCKITRLPWWIVNYHGDQVSWLRGLHAQYGPVVRYGPNDLSYGTGEAWKSIFGYEKGRSENPKDNNTFIPPINGVRHMITAAQEEHTRVRRIFSPAFSERALKQQEPLIRKYVGQLVRYLDQTAGEQVNLVDLLNFTTFDIMGDLTFGQPLGLLDNIGYTPWVASSFKALRVLGIMQFIVYYPVVRTVFGWLEPKFVTDMKMEFFNHTKERVDQRLARGSQQPDIWNLVAPSEEDGKGEVLTLNEMYANAELLMTAGTETTASSLSGLFYLLLTHPAVLEAARNEVRSSFASAEDISMEGLTNLKYLNACIQEGLRVFPPVGQGIPRVAPKGGNVVLGKWVPEGTTLLVHHTSVYRSPAGWRDPDRFAPERWLPADEPDNKYREDRRDWHQPFSYGPRNCLGQNLAWHEMRLVAAHLLYHFDVALCEEETGDWLDAKCWLVWDRKPLICRVTPVAR